MKQYKIKLTALTITLILGYWIGTTHLLDPLHETFHVMRAGRDGSAARVTGWSRSQIDYPTIASMTAGYRGCLYVGICISLIGAIAGRKRVILTGGFGLGYMISTYIISLNSHDFYNGIYSISQKMFGEQSKYLFPILRQDIIQGWSIFFVISLILVISTMVVCIFFPKWRKKKTHIASYSLGS